MNKKWFIYWTTEDGYWWRKYDIANKFETYQQACKYISTYSLSTIKEIKAIKTVKEDLG